MTLLLVELAGDGGEVQGLRGLITSNVVRRGRVQRGSVAMATISAPAGTRFTSFRWAGTARRRDCRYALQLYADAPDIDPVPIMHGWRFLRSC